MQHLCRAARVLGLLGKGGAAVRSRRLASRSGGVGAARAFLASQSEGARRKRRRTRQEREAQKTTQGPAGGVAMGPTGRDEDEAAVAVTWAGAAVNVGLCGAKAYGGFVGGSTALISDAAHSLADLLSDAVTLVSYKEARKPPDEDHPYGHGKIESMGTLTISALLVATGIGVGYHAVEVALPFLHAGLDAPHGTAPPEPVAFAVAAASIGAKEVLYRVTRAVGQRVNSTVLVANAEHHRSDALSSGVALLGIGAASAGYAVLDPLCGVVVAGMIVKVGGEMAYASAQELTDLRSSRSDEERLSETVRAVGEGAVKDCVLRARRMGPNLVADCVLEVDGLLSASAAHTIGEHVRLELLERHGDMGLQDVAIQIKPLYRDRVTRKTDLLRMPHHVEEEVRRCVMESVPEVLGITACHIFYNVNRPSMSSLREAMPEWVPVPAADGKVRSRVRSPRGITVELDVVLHPELTIRGAHSVAQRVRAVGEALPDVSHVDVHLELEDYAPQDKALTPVARADAARRAE